MQLGKEYHSAYLARAKPSSKTMSDLYLKHEPLNLSGIIDLIEIRSNEIILHEVKYTKPPRRVPSNDYLQLLAQAALVEHNLHAKVSKAMVTYPRGVSIPVFLPGMKEQILTPILRTIREIIHYELLLPPTSASQKCQDCEFFKTCKRA